MKIEDKLNNYLNESIEKNTINAFKKLSIPIKNVVVKREIVFTLKNGIDEQDWNNFNLIDDIHRMLKKIYTKALITHDYDQFIVKEL